MMTKHVPRETLDTHMTFTDLHREAGRATTAPQTIQRSFVLMGLPITFFKTEYRMLVLPETYDTVNLCACAHVASVLFLLARSVLVRALL